MPNVFDSKIWNPEVFEKYLSTVPRVKQNALISSGVLRVRNDLKAKLVDQVGGNYIIEPIVGRIGGDVLNYDGATNITATGLDTYSRGMIVHGRAKAWHEKDFTKDITGHDFMENIAAQVGEYWDDVHTADLIATINGIFGVETSDFNTKHTLDLTTGDNKKVDATSLNNAIQKASGANKNLFALAIMHSQVATNLENLQILEYWKQTDANGVQRQTSLASWNGRTVLIDDEMVDASGSDPVYTTYLLGRGSIDYCDCGAKVPNETWRDPHTDGGIEELITRNRTLYAPVGFSFVNTDLTSPTTAQLGTAANWDLAKNTGEGQDVKYYPESVIPIARIKSLG